MLQVLGSTWSLLLGVLLLMLGNGVQGTLLGIRGDIEGFSTFEMSLVMSAYFVGFLGGSRLAPKLIQRVGHVRVFAALGSFTSAILILFPTLTDPWAWIFLRILIGFCFSGIYVTAEGWLNNSVGNENRGKALSLYVIVQMVGIITAQGLLVLGDPSGFVLFVIPSVLVSISFAPILLSVAPTPSFEATKPMTLTELYAVSPLGCVGIFLLGGIFSALFGMGSVYATQADLTVGEISIFIAMIYIGGMLMQYPIGWISDRMDRRVLIMGVAMLGGGAAVLGFIGGGVFGVLLVAAFVIGGTANPLYALLIAYTNDMLSSDKMASASGGMIFINGLGAISGPIVTGWIMTAVGPPGFWLFLIVLMFALGGYAIWRMTRRASTVAVDDTATYAVLTPTVSPVAVELAQDIYAENLDEDVDDTATVGGAAPGSS